MIFITPFLVLIGVCECMHEGVCVWVCVCVFVCVRESEGYKFEPM